MAKKHKETFAPTNWVCPDCSETGFENGIVKNDSKLCPTCDGSPVRVVEGQVEEIEVFETVEEE